MDDSDSIEKGKDSPTRDKKVVEPSESGPREDDQVSKEVTPPEETISWTQRLKKGLESSRKQVGTPVDFSE